jgi:hypothetical protein
MRFKLLLILFFSCGQLICNEHIASLSSWKNTIEMYPEKKVTSFASPLKCENFMSLLNEHAALMQERLSQDSLWVNSQDQASNSFTPYVQKLVVPENAEIAFWGDLHGSVHSLVRSLTRLKNDGIIDDDFKIIKPNFYMIFLGDYVDRGFYGIEVIYTLLKLKTVNPDHVFMVRGNHEDLDLNAHYGFALEWRTKFGDQDMKELETFYNQLPVALFVGNGTQIINYVLCCHGCIEPGFDPQTLLSSQGDVRFAYLGQLKRADWLASLPHNLAAAVKFKIPAYEYQNFVPQSPTSPMTIGFMWFDCIVDEGQSIIDYTYGRGWALGANITQNYFEHYSCNEYKYVEQIMVS